MCIRDRSTGTAKRQVCNSSVKLTMADPEVFLTGELGKKGQDTFSKLGIHSFQKRFFILSLGKLCWYETRDAPLQGSLETDKISEVRSHATHPFMTPGQIEIVLEKGDPRMLKSLEKHKSEAESTNVARWLTAFKQEKLKRKEAARTPAPAPAPAPAPVPEPSPAEPSPAEKSPTNRLEDTQSAPIHSSTVVLEPEPVRRHSEGILDGLRLSISQSPRSSPAVRSATNTTAAAPARRKAPEGAKNTGAVGEFGAWRESYSLGGLQDAFVDSPPQVAMSGSATYSSKHGERSDLTERLVPEDEDEDDDKGCCQKCCHKCVIS
eukprot:TRINITY_DN2695_c0_g1_i2.p1 TRINITY_DN2695_c0_g1~~TRINITY_DN2695_c0_g1_i2.p1  ORF type:complete len:321 (+),score=65.07 TRINITY_DN2695_c0_g1_i2:137-1099(+)